MNSNYLKQVLVLKNNIEQLQIDIDYLEELVLSKRVFVTNLNSSVLQEKINKDILDVIKSSIVENKEKLALNKKLITEM